MVNVDRTFLSHPADATVSVAQRDRQGVIAGHRLLFAVLDTTNTGIDRLLADPSLGVTLAVVNSVEG